MFWNTKPNLHHLVRFVRALGRNFQNINWSADEACDIVRFHCKRAYRTMFNISMQTDQNVINVFQNTVEECLLQEFGAGCSENYTWWPDRNRKGELLLAASQNFSPFQEKVEVSS